VIRFFDPQLLTISLGHEKELEKKDYDLVSFAFSLGVIAKLISNLYLNFWIDTHFYIVGDKKFKVGNHYFHHDDVGLDLSIALGWHF